MLHLVLGFKGMAKEAEPVTLYLGYDGAEAQQALKAKPPKGVKRVEWFIRPICSRRHVFLDDEQVAAAKIEEAAAAAEPPPEEKPAAKKKAKGDS